MTDSDSSGTVDARAGVAVALSGVSKTYRSGGGEPVTAVCGVTVDLPAGQSVALTGRSGSGKSTLLHLIGAMDLPELGPDHS